MSNMKQEKVVVIGSNSFSGSHFVHHALQQDLKVIGMSRSPQPHPVFLPYNQQSDFFQFFQFDLNHHLAEIITVIEKHCPDYIINFAAQGMVAESWIKPEDWFQTNVLANVQLHDKLRKFDFIKKYVHVSTPEVYGSCSGLITENTHYHPSTPYAVSRAAADLSLHSFYQAYNFPVVLTRAANVYGPGQQLYRIIPRCIFFFLTGKKLQLHGGGHSFRSFIHIEDVAAATLKIAQKGGSGEIFHLATKSNIAIKELVHLITSIMGVSYEENVEVSTDRLGKDSAYLLDSYKARTELDWTDKISLENGIEQTIQWVKDNLAILSQQPCDYIHKP